MGRIIRSISRFCTLVTIWSGIFLNMISKCLDVFELFDIIFQNIFEKVIVKGLLLNFGFQKFFNVIKITSFLASSLTTFQTFIFRAVGGSIRS